MLLKSFPKLYPEFCSIPAENLLNVGQVFHFVGREMFEKSLPDTDLLEALIDCCQEYPHEITQILSMSTQIC